MSIASELCYASPNGYLPLPKWGQFFIELGAAIAELHTADRRLVVALAIPTRAYAAAFLSLGAVVARLAQPAHDPESTREHFESLCSLEIGTPVVIRRKGTTQYKGVFAGYRGTDIGGTPRIEIKVAMKGDLKLLLTPELSLGVEPAVAKEIKLPMNKPHQHIIISNEPFVSGIVPRGSLRLFGTKSRLECAVVGPKGILNHEIKDTVFALRQNGSRIVDGTLQDIVRAHWSPSDDKTYRSVIVPIESVSTLAAEWTTPHIVLFDGALGFVKSRDKWGGPKRVIVLDRTGAHFQEATDIVNAGYVTRTNGTTLTDIGGMPAGVELIAYEEMI